MTEPDFAARVALALEERDLSPRPRWTFILRNALITSLVFVSVLLGALTVATSGFLLRDRDWDLSVQLGQRETLYTLESLPFLWLGALALLVLVTYQLLTRTRRGYRFAPVTVLGGSVLASLALGSALYAVGAGPRTHEYFRANVPAYDRFVISRDRFWANPQRGLLGGTVQSATSTAEFLLLDPRGNLWDVTVTGDSAGVIAGGQVRAVGEASGTSTFVAEFVRPWERAPQMATSARQ